MSFWNTLKPATRAPVATNVELSPDRRLLSLTWSDGVKTVATARHLRQSCPCAGCVEEWTGRRTLDVEAVPQVMTLDDVSGVGNYALSFTFSDGHHTGIYEWKALRRLTEPPQANPTRA
jgi:DUF971 family protein